MRLHLRGRCMGTSDNLLYWSIISSTDGPAAQTSALKAVLSGHSIASIVQCCYERELCPQTPHL